MNTVEKRFNELYDRAYNKHYITYTEFLNLEEQSILSNSFLPCVKFGGYENAERIVAGFGEDVQTESFPISCICIKPVQQKFADKLGHRDFLGAVMNLGIKRELLGDIIIEDNCGYLFCLEHISGYIADNLNKIRHTTVKAELLSSLPELAAACPDTREITVASLRLDALVAGIYRLSRKEASLLFAQGRIFVNSKQTTNSSHIAKENDMVSVRGFGRFQLVSQIRTTKKDRMVIEVRVY